MNSKNYTVHFKIKNCQTNPPGTLNVSYILVIHSTDKAQVSFILIKFANQVALQSFFPRLPKIKIRQQFY